MVEFISNVVASSMINRQDIQRAKLWQGVLKSLTTLSYRSHDLSSYLHDVTCAVSKLLESDWSIVTLYEGAKGRIVASSLDTREAETAFWVHESVSETVVRSGRPFFISDVKQCPEEARRMAGYVCYLGVPLRVVQGEVIGTICSFSMQPQQYGVEVITTVELLAERAATAIDNYRLYQQQQQFNERLEAEVTRRTMELHEAQARLIERERLAAIGEFTAMIVHEIRNPLTTVQMGLHHFAKLELSEASQARLSLAIAEAARLTNLLQEILSYSKPQILRLTEIDVDSFIQDLLVSLQLMPAAQGRSIEYSPPPGSVLILGDVEKLKQVFINLVRNACEAVEPGETVHWSVTQHSPDQVSISVQNGGLPIPADVLLQVTHPFYSTKAEGTGLGLAIVKRIVEAHSGELCVESSEAKGTIFSVRLPIK